MRMLSDFRRLAILGACVILVACGGSEDEATPTPVPVTDAAAATVSPTVSPAGTPTVDDTTMLQVTLAPTPAGGPASAAAANATIPGADAMATAPVLVEAAADCVLESDLDLAGFPGLEAEMGCAAGAARTDPVGFNEFGPGPDFSRFMLWLSWEEHIYALFPDGRWQRFQDTWSEDQPTFSCNPLEGEPASPPLPRRGFGKVWCEQPDVREAMGTIEVEERLCQHAVTQEFERGRLIACFEDATIRYYQLFNDGTWAAVLQP